MIKWKGRRGNREVVGFGLEERNLKKLRADEPIYVMGEEMGLPFDVLIYYGKDMATLVKMSRSGITKDTIIHDERKRKKQ